MNIYVVCQENPWVTNDIFDYWIDNIFFHMENLLTLWLRLVQGPLHLIMEM